MKTFLVFLSAFVSLTASAENFVNPWLTIDGTQYLLAKKVSGQRFNRAISASRFIVEVGTQACQSNDGAQFCGGTVYATERVQLDENPFQKMFVANELSKPFSFHLTLVVRKNSEGKGYICRVLLKNAEDGSGLGSYSTHVNSLEELNEIKLGSGQVNISPTESYYGWVKLNREFVTQIP